jgi:hypothetical protein
VKAEGLKFTGSGDTLEIVLSGKGASVTGMVRNRKGDPLPAATVVLIPPPELRGNSRAYRPGQSDASGQFSITSIEPGKYKLYAFEDIAPGAYYDPDFMRLMEKRGADVELKESAQQTLDSEAIPAEETPDF